MNNKPRIKPEVYQAIQNIDCEKIHKADRKHIRPLLPCIVRMTVCHPLDLSSSWADKIQDFWQIIYHDENVNGIISILDINYLHLEKDTEAEKNLL